MLLGNTRINNFIGKGDFMKSIRKYIAWGLMLTFTTICLLACGRASDSSTAELKEGITLEDIVEEIDDQIGIQMPGDIDDQILVDLYYMDMTNVETYAGQASLTMTSCDTVVGVKAVPGKLDAVVASLEKRQQDLINSFERYLPEQYQKAQAGSVITRGDYAFLIIIGTSQDTIGTDMQKAEDIIDSYFK